MYKILHIILIFLFSLTMISCSADDTEKIHEPIRKGGETVNDVLDPVDDVVNDGLDVVNDGLEEVTGSGGDSNTTLSAPSGLTATGTAGQVSLDWSAVTSASSYTVYWDNATGISSSSTAITSVSTDNYIHSSLDNGSKYYYKVAAVASDNTIGSLSSEVNAATPLPATDNFSASGANNTITLTWNSVSGATGYTLYWDNVSGIDSSDTAITSITNDNYTHSNMDNGSTYYYKVAAVNSSGTGTLSSVASALLSADIQGSETNEGHTYALTSSTMNWATAASAAAAVGGYLATLNTREENDWLYDKFSNYGGSSRDLWIGSKDNVTEGTWYWYNGLTSTDGGVTDNISSGALWPDGTAKWYSNEPNDYNNGSPGEDCGTLRGHSRYQKRWNDMPCSNANGGHYTAFYGIIEID